MMTFDLGQPQAENFVEVYRCVFTWGKSGIMFILCCVMKCLFVYMLL